MFNIMLVKSTKDVGGSYSFLTKIENEETVIVNIETEAELDTFVEDMLNNKGYAKSDFIIVEKKEYNITADIA